MEKSRVAPYQQCYDVVFGNEDYRCYIIIFGLISDHFSYRRHETKPDVIQLSSGTDIANWLRLFGLSFSNSETITDDRGLKNIFKVAYETPKGILVLGVLLIIQGTLLRHDVQHSYSQRCTFNQKQPHLRYRLRPCRSGRKPESAV